MTGIRMALARMALGAVAFFAPDEQKEAINALRIALGGGGGPKPVK